MRLRNFGVTGGALRQRSLDPYGKGYLTFAAGVSVQPQRSNLSGATCAELGSDVAQDDTSLNHCHPAKDVTSFANSRGTCVEIWRRMVYTVRVDFEVMVFVCVGVCHPEQSLNCSTIASHSPNEWGANGALSH